MLLSFEFEDVMDDIISFIVGLPPLAAQFLHQIEVLHDFVDFSFAQRCDLLRNDQFMRKLLLDCLAPSEDHRLNSFEGQRGINVFDPHLQLLRLLRVCSSEQMLIALEGVF
jgi:hypothetical protein